MSEKSRFERRWANRRATGNPAVSPPPPTELPTAEMQLLSDYEDAIYASARHGVKHSGDGRWDENAHTVEAVRLYSDVRRLRMEIHALIEGRQSSQD